MSSGTLPLFVRRQRLDALLGALGLCRDPFPVTPDYESYFFSPRLQTRYDELLSAVALRKGFVLVTGDVGVGKTTLARLLINAMQGQGVRTALVINTFVQGLELLRVINRDFGLEGCAQTIDGLLAELHAFLLEQYAAGANCVLLIDDAQSLTVDSLELLRQLSNLETSRHKLLQLVLVGQPELIDLVGRAELRQLRSRIAMHLELEPMTLEEMDAYLFHRMAAAGNGGALTVDADALRLLWERTDGYPRRVHLVMDRCLFGALARQVQRIDRGLMREAISEVDLPARSGTRSRPAQPVRRVGWERNWAGWGAAALLVLAALIAAVRLEGVRLTALDTLVAKLRPYIGHASAAQNSGEAVPVAAVVQAMAAAPAEAVAPAEAAGPIQVAAPVRESAPAVPPAHALFAQVPQSVWASFWARFGAGNLVPVVASLPAERSAALGALDRHLEPTGLRSFLLAGAVAVCPEHASLRFSSADGSDEARLVFAQVPRAAVPIEFGRVSAAARWVQQRLRAHGLLQLEHVDGLLGPVTVTALAHFQREAGLAATGLIDETSLYRLSCAGPRELGAALPVRAAP